MLAGFSMRQHTRIALVVLFVCVLYFLCPTVGPGPWPVATPQSTVGTLEPSYLHPSPETTAFEDNLHVKKRLLRFVAPGMAVPGYYLAERVYFVPWNAGATISILGALWAEGLPHLELLAFHRLLPTGPKRSHMMSRLANCVSTRPPELPRLVFLTNVTAHCTAWWPTSTSFKKPFQNISRRSGHPMITTVRYFCPVPEAVVHSLTEAPAFYVRLLPSNATRASPVPLRLVRRAYPFVSATACTEPLWGYPRMQAMYPSILDEWVAYHKLKGFGRILFYEQLFRNFSADLGPWKEAGLVEYYPAWASGLWARDVDRLNTCTQSAAHDHCVFVSQLRSRWVAMVHGLDLYYCSNCQACVPVCLFGGLVQRGVRHAICNQRNVSRHRLLKRAGGPRDAAGSPRLVRMSAMLLLALCTACLSMQQKARDWSGSGKARTEGVSGEKGTRPGVGKRGTASQDSGGAWVSPHTSRTILSAVARKSKPSQASKSLRNKF